MSQRDQSKVIFMQRVFYCIFPLQRRIFNHVSCQRKMYYTNRVRTSGPPLIIQKDHITQTDVPIGRIVYLRWLTYMTLLMNFSDVIYASLESKFYCSLAEVKSLNYISDVKSSFSHGLRKFFWLRLTCKIIILSSHFLTIFLDLRDACDVNLTMDS